MKDKSFYSQLPKEILLVFTGKNIRNYIFNKQFSNLKPPKLKLTENDLNLYTKSVSKVNFWHGTGKFKYENGKKSDILSGIFENGLKKP